MSKSCSTSFSYRLFLIILPDFINNPGRVIILGFNIWITIEFKVRNVFVIDLDAFFFWFSRWRYSCRYIINFKHFSHLLLSLTVVLIGSPLIVKFCSYLSIFFLCICFSNKRMLKKFWPRKSFTRSLIKKALKETFEFRTHIFWKLDWIFNNEVNQSVDAIGIEWRGSYKEFIYNNT